MRLSWTGWLGVVVVTFWALVALAGPHVAPYHEARIIADGSFLPAGGEFLLGSDYLGRDVLSRILWGARTTIGIALAATFLAYAIGITLGVAAAVRGGWTDTLLSRANDAILALPGLMFALVVLAALGSSIPVLIGTAAAVYMSGVFRLSRALAQDVMVQDFVEVARVRGEGSWWIIRREVMPNITAPLITDFGFRLVFVILLISGLSFLGLGVQPPAADWGSMVRENMQGLSYGALAAVWPAGAIASLTIAINLIVDDVSADRAVGLARKML
jgi:peptide/nickel transport system permease protein